jgi:type I restriction enzyme, S subunit
MGSDSWETLTLDAVAHYQNGRATKPAEARDDGMLVVKIRELNSGVSEKSVRVDPNAVETKHRICDGDLLFAWSASVGIYVWRGEEAALNQHIFRVQAKPGTDQLFLRYLLEYELRALLAAAAERQTTMGHVRKADLARLTCRRPSIDEQRAIAEVLGALDDRIEWCASTSALVLDMSDALWGHAVAADGEEVLLGEIASFLNRRRIPLSAREREARPGPFPYYGATGVFGYVDDFLFDGNYVLVGEDGSVVNDDGTAVVQYATGRFWVNNHAHVLESERFTAEELFLALRRTVVTGYVTGAAQPKLSMGRLKQVPLRVPSAAAVDGLRHAVAALFARHRAAAAEAASLRDMRDALLPRLLSGEVRVEDPARVLGAVA